MAIGERHHATVVVLDVGHIPIAVAVLFLVDAQGAVINAVLACVTGVCASTAFLSQNTDSLTGPALGTWHDFQNVA